MEINTSLVFPADPATVFGMMTDPDFLTEVAKEAGSLDQTIRVNGLTTTSERTLAAPDAAKKFTGDTIRIVEERVWSEAQPDGARTASLNLTSPGQPISMPGSVSLTPQGDSTRIDIVGDLTVKIPLVGKKLEKMAAPAVEDGIRAEQRVALRRLGK
ncbi:DUF2505 domain-containing protein [Granulicoccus sp. GXG6511]|uniref:DUF2505 domain-containing protein n=1 Tax=Granulicoccus sp. GXG6511 TaxID=3381351 RepID=UPI003D7D5694